MPANASCYLTSNYIVMHVYDEQTNQAIGVIYLKKPVGGKMVAFTQDEWDKLQGTNLPAGTSFDAVQVDRRPSCAVFVGGALRR
jgi:hypothetical protein